MSGQGRLLIAHGALNVGPRDEGALSSSGFGGGGISRLGIILEGGGEFSRGEEGEILGEKFDADLGKFVGQYFAIIVYINTNFCLGNNRSVVQQLVHLH